MQDLNDLYYFVQAVKHGGFAPASRALGIAKSKLSRRVAALEERLGVRLIQRSTRHFLITEVGQRYFEHCQAMLVEAEAAQETIDSLRAEPKGCIKLTCPVGLLHFHVGQMLAEFMALYPQISVYLEATNRRVDVLAEGVDIALRVRPLPLEDSDLALRILSDRGQSLVASPELIERQGGPARHTRNPAALAKPEPGYPPGTSPMGFATSGWPQTADQFYAPLYHDRYGGAQNRRHGRCGCSSASCVDAGRAA